MDWYRIKHTLMNCLISDACKRAEYMKKQNIFHHMGDKCMIQSRKIPLYPQLISFGNNVWIGANVTFCTHDVIHHMLNNKTNKHTYIQSTLVALISRTMCLLGQIVPLYQMLK